MELKLIKANEFEPNIKCSIHKNGKLGFSSSAITRLGIDTNKRILFATMDDENGNGSLYAIIVEEKNEEAFRVNKAGNYCYLNTKAMFDKLGYNYQNRRIMFDIVTTDMKHDDKTVYKLIKREGRSKK
jgi:hypothetical protein